MYALHICIPVADFALLSHVNISVQDKLSEPHPEAWNCPFIPRECSCSYIRNKCTISVHCRRQTLCTCP